MGGLGRYLRSLPDRWRMLTAATRYSLAAAGLALALLAGGAALWSSAGDSAQAPAARTELPAGAARLAEQQQIEKALEQNIVGLLEPALGSGAIVARVNVVLDRRELESTADSHDPDSAILRPEGGLGAIDKTTTRIVSRVPRLARLSAAVLVSGLDGQARPPAELQRLAALAQHAVGFDAERGDRFEISSAPFAGARLGLPLALGGVALLLAALGAVRFWRPWQSPPTRPAEPQAEADPAKMGSLAARERARQLVQADPARAAHLLRAWIALDSEPKDNRA
jgi:flagellar M-ring protein FliF